LGKLQPFFSTSEYDQATELLDASAPLKAALEARGIQITGKISDQVFFDQYAPSRDPSTDGNPTRLMRILFADRQGGQNNYGPYLEGLTALVDLYNHRILSITDTHGPTPRSKVPHDVFFERAPFLEHVQVDPHSNQQ
jgi:Cu2+-containing amine oxidase